MGSELPNLDQIKAKARKLFNVEDFLVQTWDGGFEEWVDLEENETVENNTKILITENVLTIPCELSSTLSSLSSITDDNNTSW